MYRKFITMSTFERLREREREGGGGRRRAAWSELVWVREKGVDDRGHESDTGEGEMTITATHRIYLLISYLAVQNSNIKAFIFHLVK